MRLDDRLFLGLWKTDGEPDGARRKEPGERGTCDMLTREYTGKDSLTLATLCRVTYTGCWCFTSDAVRSCRISATEALLRGM